MKGKGEFLEGWTEGEECCSPGLSIRTDSRSLCAWHHKKDEKKKKQDETKLSFGLEGAEQHLGGLTPPTVKWTDR